MKQELRNPGDILFSILNTTYQFLGEKGGGKLLKEWCEYTVEHGLWSGVVEYTREGGIQGLKKFWDDFLVAEQFPPQDVTTEIVGEREFVMTLKKCHSLNTLKEIGAQVYGDACLHCVHICKKMGDLNDYDVDIQYNSNKGTCVRRWIKRK